VCHPSRAPSTITRGCFTRPDASAFSHAGRTSSALFSRDWPLPDDDITGFTKQGNPIPLPIASRNSSKLEAKA
jgi:hypothetical protein